MSSLPTGWPAAKAVEMLTFAPVTTREFRLLQAPGGGGQGGFDLMVLREIGVM